MNKLTAFLLALLPLFPFATLADVKETFIEDSPSNRVVRAGWINVDSSHHLSGRSYTPEDLNTRVVVVHRWCYACPNIEHGVKDFQQLARRYSDTDFVFLTSYFPGAAHPRDQVEEQLKRLKVLGPVYVGAASVGVRISRDHRALYIAEGGTNEVWSLRLNNTDIKSLSKYLDDHRADLEEASLRLAAEHAPGRALVQYKRLRKAKGKLAAKLSPLISPIDTPENRRMAELEEKVSAFLAKGGKNPKDRKQLQAQLTKFAQTASPELKDEIDALVSALAP